MIKLHLLGLQSSDVVQRQLEFCLMISLSRGLPIFCFIVPSLIIDIGNEVKCVWYFSWQVGLN